MSAGTPDLRTRAEAKRACYRPKPAEALIKRYKFGKFTLNFRKTLTTRSLV